jgi:membrane fusion protein, copper/silver efflux system
MTRPRWMPPILAAILAAGIGGYWLGHRGSIAPATMTTTSVTQTKAPAPSVPVIYYRDPDGKPFYSSEPKNTPDGRPFRAVLASEDISFEPNATKPTTAERPPRNRRILYYRNPMGLPDISYVPKKDSMGMDYIPVYEGEDDDSSGVTLSPGRIQRIGVISEPAIMRVISEPVRAPGTIQLDERMVSVISMRAEAFVEKVENVTSGSEVRKGQPLMRVYSPAMVAAAADYLAVLDTRGNSAVAMRGSRQRLVNLAVPESVLTEMERTRQMPLTFNWVAPTDGIVLERNVVDGMRVMPGAVLFRLADHSVVWAVVDVAERDLAGVAEGQPVAVRVRSYPDRTFPGKVALVYPHLNPATRTVRVRIELPNPDHLLLPDMYAEAVIDTGSGKPVLAVPDSAVIDSGDRQIVIVDKGEGRFEPRPVKLGRRGAGYVGIREGIADGEKVVTSANFLIDAESNLKAALKSLTGASAPQ